MANSVIDLDLALVDAVKRGDVESTSALLASGADSNAIDLIDEHPVLQLAMRRGYAELAALLQFYGAKRIAKEASAKPGKGSAEIGEQGQQRQDPPRKPATRQKTPQSDRQDRTPALLDLYLKHGYIRRPSHESADDSSCQVRFIFARQSEIKPVSKVLRNAGFLFEEPKKLFGYHTLIVSGRAAVEKILRLRSSGWPSRDS